jgi:hypothetical protein
MITFAPSERDAGIFLRVYYFRQMKPPPTEKEMTSEIRSISNKVCRLIAIVLWWNCCNSESPQEVFEEEQHTIITTILGAAGIDLVSSRS